MTKKIEGETNMTNLLKHRIHLLRWALPVWVLAIAGCCLVTVATSTLALSLAPAAVEPAGVVPTDVPPTTAPPTDVPTATNTPAPTAVPTNTPVPTKEHQPQAEIEYLQAVGDIAGRYQELFNLFSKCMDRAVDDSTLWLDPTWKKEVGTILGLIRVLNDEVRALDCPESCEGIQLHLSRAADNYDDFTQLFAEGADELNPDKVKQATVKMQDGSAAIEKATERIDALD